MLNGIDRFLKIKQLLPELMVYPQWIGFKLRPAKKPGKVDKLPINPRTGGLAMTNVSSTWSTFDAAVKAVYRHQIDGIGFVFTHEAGIIGIDLDNCLVDGQTQPWAAQIVGQMNSYTEISPSGAGLHILARGSIPAGKRKLGPIEMYANMVFFTMTGNVLTGFERLHDRSAEISALYQRLFVDNQPQKGTRK